MSEPADKVNGGDAPPISDALADYHRQRLADGAACLQAALDYLARDWPVVALCPPDHVGVARVSEDHARTCKTPGKRPWHRWKEFQGRPPSEAEVREWWRRMPNSNVGVALGRVLRVDVDGPAGEDRLRQLSGGDLPPTLEFTGDISKGSRGLLYLAPPGIDLRTTSELPREGEELRLQGRGAQTVLPPSRHRKGMLYAWRPGHSPHEIEPAPAPAWLVRHLRAPAGPRSPSPASGRPGNPAGPAAPADMALALEALRHLSPERAARYDSWLHVGMALHAVSDGGEMLAAWDEWSRQCEAKYAEGVCAAKWATFHRAGTLQLSDLLRWAQRDTGWAPSTHLVSARTPPARRRGAGLKLSFTWRVGA
jgi:hypothetical protein